MILLPIEPILVFILVLIRVAVFFSFLPIFSEVYLPVRVRMAAAAGIAFVFFPVVKIDPAVFPQTLAGMAAMMAPEALLGFSFAMVGRILFGTIQLAGNLVGDQMGFNMAQMVDPSSGGQVPLMAQTFYIFSLLVFFTVDAHHFFFAALGRSFEATPPGFLAGVSDLTGFFRERTARMFVIGLQLSMPIVATLFVSTMAMGMLAKSVPRINVFMESFPIRILVGLLILGSGGGYLMHRFSVLCAEVERDLLTILDLISP